LAETIAEAVLIATIRLDVAAAPLGVTLEGLKVHVPPDGSPLQARLVAALKPLMGVIVTVAVAEPPVAVTVLLVGLSEMEKSAVGGALTATTTAGDTEAAKFPFAA
jgi:hypothetical protein